MEKKSFSYNFNQKGTQDISQYLIIRKLQKELINKIISDMKIDSSSPQAVVESVQKYFISRPPRYKRDTSELWNWESFLNTWKGDCDDVAGAMHVIINTLLDTYNFSEHKERLWFHVNQNYTERHANNIWLADNGLFYTVESTMDLKGTFYRKWLNVPLKYDSFYTNHDAFAKSTGSHYGSNIIREDLRGESLE